MYNVVKEALAAWIVAYRSLPVWMVRRSRCVKATFSWQTPLTVMM